MSIQAATLQADVVANTDQAYKSLFEVWELIDAVAKAAGDNLSLTVTADTRQAQEALAGLQTALQPEEQPIITPEVDAGPAEKSIDDLVEDLKARLKDNKPILEPEVNSASAVGALGEFLGIVKTTATEAAFAFNQITTAVNTVLQPLEQVGKAALSAYEDNERLTASYDALVAKELMHAGAAGTTAEAYEKARFKAQELIEYNQQLAISSPFTDEVISKAERTALSYGLVSTSADASVVSAERLTKANVDVVAAMGGTGEMLQSVSLAMSQMSQKATLSGEEVRQLANVGISVDQILADAFHKPTEEIVDMREKGLIPGKEAVLALTESFEKDFGGAAARQANTIVGLQTSLEGLTKIGLREFFTGTFEAIQPELKEFVDLASKPETQAQIRAWGDALGHGVAEVLPPLVEGLKDTAQFLGDVYNVGSQVVGFIGSAAEPALVGVTAATALYAAANANLAVEMALDAAAMTAELIPALLESATALATAGTAAAVAAGPFVAVGAAIAGVAVAWNDLEQKIESGAQGVLNNQQSWKDSTTTLDAYSKASDATKQAVQGNIDVINQNREALRSEVEQLEQIGGLLGTNSENYKEGLETVRQHSQALDDNAKYVENQIAGLEKAHAAATAAAGSTGQLADATGKLNTALEPTGDALKKVVEQMQKLADEGADAYGKQNQIASDHNDKLQSLTDQHNQAMLGIVQAGEKAQEDAAGEHQKKLNDLVDKAGDEQSAAKKSENDKIKSLQDAFNRGSQDAEVDLLGKMIELDHKRGDERAAAYQTEQAKLVELHNNAAIAQQGIEQDLQDKLTDIAEKSGDQRADLADAHARKVRDIQKDMDALGGADAQAAVQAKTDVEQSSYNERLSDLEQAAAATRAVDEREYGERLADLHDHLTKAEDDENQSYDTRLANQQAKVEDALRKVQETYQDNQYKLQTIVRDGQEALGDLQADHDGRLDDLRSNAQSKQASLTESHEDKLAQIERDKTHVTSMEQLRRLEESEAQEKADYQRKSEQAAAAAAKAEADENAAYEKKRQRQQRELNEQLEAEKRAADQRVAVAEDAVAKEQEAVTSLTTAHQGKIKDLIDTYNSALQTAAREQDDKLTDLETKLHADEEKAAREHGQKIVTIEGETSAEQIAKKRAALQDKLNAENESYGISISHLDRSVGEQISHAQREHDEKSKNLTDALGRDTVKAQQAYETRLKDIDTALAATAKKEADSYWDRLGKLQTALDDGTGAARKAYETRLTDIDTALGKATTKEDGDYKDRQLKLQGAFAERIKAENDHYADAEKVENAAYAKAEAAQNKHLGQLLDDYLKAEEARYPAMAGKLEQQRRKVEDEYGLIDKAGVKAWQDITQATNDSLGMTGPKLDAATQTLRNQRDGMFETAIAAQQLGDKTDVLTQKINTSKEATSLWSNAWDGLEHAWAWLMGANPGPSGGSSGFGGLPARANGGPVDAGQMYVVGERGPEVLVTGSQSGMVFPNAGSGAGAGSANNTRPVEIHIHAGAIVQQSALGDYLRQAMLDFYRDNPGASKP